MHPYLPKLCTAIYRMCARLFAESVYCYLPKCCAFLFTNFCALLFTDHSIAKYRELVEQKINELVSSNPLLQKIKEGKEITTSETEQLAEELHNEHPHITIDLLRRVYNHRKAQFVQFIKHILGIEVLESFPETVSKAFDDFISKHSYLSSRQLQFMDLLRNYILEKGDLQKRNLIESPFTLIHPQGIRGVFSPTEIDEILIFTEKLTAA